MSLLKLRKIKRAINLFEAPQPRIRELKFVVRNQCMCRYYPGLRGSTLMDRCIGATATMVINHPICARYELKRMWISRPLFRKEPKLTR